MAAGRRPPALVSACRWRVGAVGAAGGPAEPVPLYDPAASTPALGGPSAQRKRRVRRRGVEERPDVLTFTAEALRDPLEIIGAVRATVYLRSSVEHTDVAVHLCDVDRSGRSVNIWTASGG